MEVFKKRYSKKMCTCLNCGHFIISIQHITDDITWLQRNTKHIKRNLTYILHLHSYYTLTRTHIRLGV